MSKMSTKQRYLQLKEWLETKQTGSNSTKKSRSFSKADHYNKANKFYGNKKSN